MMRNGLFCVVAAVALVCCAGGAQAQTLVYGFNDASIDGFFGLGAAVSQETSIGVTEGASSLKVEVGPDGFTGVRTTTVLPAALGNPPGISHVLFDLTLATEYAGGFGDIGITFFGHALNHLPAPDFGLQAQFGDLESFAGKAPATYSDLRIDLTAAADPYTFASQSFNQIFGPGPNDLTVVSGFQFYVSKNAGVPVTFYIDNVRVVPEPASLAMLGMGAMALGMVARRRR
jgi:hypothetical protein